LAYPGSTHPIWRSVRAYLKELYMWSCFAKRFTKTAPAPSIKLFIELKPKKIASLVKWSRAKRSKSRTICAEDERLIDGQPYQK
jgi:hypothetical protein